MSVSTQEEKLECLENAVINRSPDEVKQIYSELGKVEMAAKALGLACRYCGVETVKALAECGANFLFPHSEEVEKIYRCNAGYNDPDYCTDFSLSILKIFRGGLKGTFASKGLKLNQKIPMENKKKRDMLDDEKRLEVLQYLCENKDKLAFKPEKMLYYAYFAMDEVIIKSLKDKGYALSKRCIKTLTEAPENYKNIYWFEYGNMCKNLSADGFLTVMDNLSKEVWEKLGKEKRLRYTDWFFNVNENKTYEPKVMEFILERYDISKINKTQFMRLIIDNEAAQCLPLIEKLGWISAPKKRDEMIAYASDNKKTETAAWLLDFKNRTADFAKEEADREKKIERELNANPNSVTALKKIWSFRKLEDDTLIITNYKGRSTMVVVPEKIGKNEVSTIGKYAFSGMSGGYMTNEHLQNHREITKIVLHDKIKVIEDFAFAYASSLAEIEIPKSVRKMGHSVFVSCGSLKNMTIPGSIKKIENNTFANCKKLKTVIISKFVREIGQRVFNDCSRLETVEIPKTVTEIDRSVSGRATFEVFGNCPKLTVIVEKDSEAEKFCIAMNLKYKYKEETEQ